MEAIRLDKYLWAVRIFKTRSDAAEAIRQNRVLVNDAYAKPSREVRIGDRIAVKRMPVTYLFEVVGYVRAASRPRTSPTTVATSLHNRNSTSSTSPAKRSSSSATGVRDVRPKRSGANWTTLWRRYIWKKRKSNQRNIILIGQ